ncbi:hypothetical protein chiPu_0002198 [Chiloscyllium punctatum]|uniref:Uncharacterized protein n=1 Tax=Chiloscyllium punctatum TaxID=137246 RepID=A0A401S0E6_CHIPU|nr:hypothetical protein [Chiloscyllium punctatum]
MNGIRISEVRNSHKNISFATEVRRVQRRYIVSGLCFTYTRKKRKETSLTPVDGTASSLYNSAYIVSTREHIYVAYI